MKPSVAAAIITGTMARPSSPSVRLTALDAPTITSMPNGRKNQPSGISTSLKNGTARPVDSGSSWTQMMIAVATMPITNCASSLKRPGSPLVLRLVSFRKSSPKPIAP
jgi:hypothetical protein